ncbi:hypothetical protein CA13_38840 [Planctomycetes bacterium CA13]|uniref:Alpha/beta hydrolase family protein n=1 Tax=Novipirellula herctigrandis TaxID=2527986 RepID=A0A5C5Z6H4_9BACT|nr:hypothetical protein CA13_38840 [Planctomycetes bacterium CA13]
MRRILLVPGFCEPRFLLKPLRHAIRRSHQSVEIWRDRWVGRSLQTSIDRLKCDLGRDADDADHSVAIVTHSFGDWVTRQAIAELPPNHHVTHLVSIAPIMTTSPIAMGLAAIGGGLISEVPVMARKKRASMNNRLNPNLNRLIIWAKADVWVRPVEFSNKPNLKIESVWASHLSVALQPNVHRKVCEFLLT